MGAPTGAAPPPTSSASRGSWKSRLIGGGSNHGNSNNTSSSVNNNHHPRRGSSPSLRRFSNRSAPADDEKKDEDSAVHSDSRDGERARSLSESRAQRSQKKGMRGRLKKLLPKGHSSTSNSKRSSSKTSHRSSSEQEHSEESDCQHLPQQQQAGESTSAGGPPIPRSPVASPTKLSGAAGKVCKELHCSILPIHSSSDIFSCSFYNNVILTTIGLSR